MAKAEGKAFPSQPVSRIRSGFLEKIPYKGLPQIIEYSSREFSAVCPYSGLPDIGEIVIQYVPGASIVELKSLKYYFVSFRNVGITQEEALDRIFHDLKKLLRPKYLKTMLRYNTRGGIDAKCVMESGNPETRFASRDHRR